MGVFLGRATRVQPSHHTLDAVGLRRVACCDATGTTGGLGRRVGEGATTPRQHGDSPARRALAAEAHRVIAGHDLRHRINVIPVADGDTGHNLDSLRAACMTTRRRIAWISPRRLAETGPVIGAHAGQRTRVVSRQATGA